MSIIRNIADQKVELPTGRLYIAVRPLALKGIHRFQVIFIDEAEQKIGGVVHGLTFQDAHRLMILFNQQWSGKRW